MKFLSLATLLFRHHRLRFGKNSNQRSSTTSASGRVCSASVMLPRNRPSKRDSSRCPTQTGGAAPSKADQAPHMAGASRTKRQPTTSRRNFATPASTPKSSSTKSGSTIRRNQRRPDRARRSRHARPDARACRRRFVSKRPADRHAVQRHVAVGRRGSRCRLRQLRIAGRFREARQDESDVQGKIVAGPLRAEFPRSESLRRAGARRCRSAHLFRSCRRRMAPRRQISRRPCAPIPACSAAASDTCSNFPAILRPRHRSVPSLPDSQRISPQDSPQMPKIPVTPLSYHDAWPILQHLRVPTLRGSGKVRCHLRTMWGRTCAREDSSQAGLPISHLWDVVGKARREAISRRAGDRGQSSRRVGLWSS